MHGEDQGGGRGGDALVAGKGHARREKSVELGAHTRRTATSAGWSMNGQTSAAAGPNDAWDVSLHYLVDPLAGDMRAGGVILCASRVPNRSGDLATGEAGECEG